MPEFLVVRLGKDPAHASWLTVNEQGNRLTSTITGPLTAAAMQAANREVIVLVSGLDATTKRVTLPVSRQSRIQQMLPYTLEDAVADDVDDLLFAAGPRDSDGSIPVAIVARELVEHWLRMCSDAGLRPKAVFVDTQGVPETPGNLTLLLEGHRIFGRVPSREPFVFEDLSLAEVIELLATEKDAKDDTAGAVLYADEDSYKAHEADIDIARDKVAALEVSLLPDGILPRLAATLIGTPGSNLLQGPFAVRSDWGQLLRPWRLPAALALILIGAVTAGLGARYYSLAREDQALAATLESNCRAAFGSANLQACETEVRARLTSSGQRAGGPAGAGFLGTLGSVVDARDPRIVFQALSFRSGVTNLSVVAPDVQSLDNLAQALGTDGRLQANIQSATPGDDGIEGRIQIAESR